MNRDGLLARHSSERGHLARVFVIAVYRETTK